MKTKVETKRDQVMNAMDHYIKCTMTLSNSITELQNTQLQKELVSTVNAVQSLIDAFTEHRNAMFEEYGFEPAGTK